MDWREREELILAKYAAHAASSRGREHAEDDDDGRSPFQHDRDRIVHCQAFRRLEYKTQVFVNYEGDHYRTRLTHTLEVSQLARSVSRRLKLNEDLTEAIALAHDLGHTPFGHSGEKSLNQLMRAHGGFEHNQQSLRIVEKLEERYAAFPGLNLTREVRQGMMKHVTPWDNGPGRKGNADTLEAHVVNLVDEIAYNSHDLDDGLESGFLSLEKLRELSIWPAIQDPPRSRKKTLALKLRRYQIVRTLINLQVCDLVDTARRRLAGGKSAAQLRNAGKQILAFSPKLAPKIKQLRRYLNDGFYQHYRVKRLAEKHDRFLKQMFKLYMKSPDVMPPRFAKVAKGQRHRAACDYIAGMTDRYALKEYEKLFAPQQLF
jgi:dGTPase